jgi:hypothetical protein
VREFEGTTNQFMWVPFPGLRGGLGWLTIGTHNSELARDASDGHIV